MEIISLPLINTTTLYIDGVDAKCRLTICRFLILFYILTKFVLKIHQPYVGIPPWALYPSYPTVNS